MTYNKSQGQTLERILLDTVNHPFAHGHLYVALSRVTLYSNIRIILDESDVFEGCPTVKNITFKELVI